MSLANIFEKRAVTNSVERAENFCFRAGPRSRAEITPGRARTGLLEFYQMVGSKKIFCSKAPRPRIVTKNGILQKERFCKDLKNYFKIENIGHWKKMFWYFFAHVKLSILFSRPAGPARRAGPAAENAHEPGPAPPAKRSNLVTNRFSIS